MWNENQSSNRRFEHFNAWILISHKSNLCSFVTFFLKNFNYFFFHVRILPPRWQSVVVTWDRGTSQACLYLNGKLQAWKQGYEDSETGTSHVRYQLGWKGDYPCPKYSGRCWFYGWMSNLIIEEYPYSKRGVAQYHSRSKHP